MTISSAAITRKHSGYMSRVYGDFSSKIQTPTGTGVAALVSGDLAGVAASGRNLGVAGGGVAGVVGSAKGRGVSGSSSRGISGASQGRGVKGRGGNG